jgi:8-oxo-dGTP pyrophosphatase MutT (NUDIX family)
VGKAGVYAGEWVIPGGGVEEGETRLEALRRETLEETGIDLEGENIEEIAGVLTGSSDKTLRDTSERVHVKMNFYNYTIRLGRPASEIKVNQDDDFTEATWMTIEDLSRHKVSPPTIATLKKLGLWPQAE